MLLYFSGFVQFCCPLYNDLRIKYIPSVYIQTPNVLMFYNLMSYQNVKVIRELAMYLYFATKERILTRILLY
jgi:hypothetical protein